MATARSLESSNKRPRRRPSNMEARLQAYFSQLMCASPFHEAQSDPMRFRIGLEAFKAPRMQRLNTFSPAWNAAVLMIDCYATITMGNELHLKRSYNVTTLEEVAEGMMRDGADSVVSQRALELAVSTALHSLNWARQQYLPF